MQGGGQAWSLVARWEGFRESRRCAKDTYPESYITEDTSVYEDKLSVCFPVQGGGQACQELSGWGTLAQGIVLLSSEYGTRRTVTARFWPCFQVKALQTFRVVASWLDSGGQKTFTGYLLALPE